MSGHSKWANIKTRKGAQDKKKSEVFTRLSKDILTAIRQGGGNTKIEANSALRVAIEKAKAANMPKENIDRLILRFEQRRNNLSFLLIEVYGPSGVPIIIEAETDNKNRTLSELKLILKEGKADVAESNSVLFQFERVAEVELLNGLPESDLLELIDRGAIDLEAEGRVIVVDSAKLAEVELFLKEKNLTVVEERRIYRARNPVFVSDLDALERLADLLENLENHEEVLAVYPGFDYAKKA